MIDLSREELFPLTRAAEFVPGRRPNASTIYRWVLKGIRGVRLETLLVGGCRLTSREALERFFRATTVAADAALAAPLTASDLKRRSARQSAIEAEMSRRGF